MAPLSRDQIAARAARDIPDGAYVNLGIGLPTLVANYVPPGREVIYHSENGILGMGPAPPPGRENPDLINASKQHVTLAPGAAIFHHTDAFVMMRGGHIEYALLGGMQVSMTGDLANWSTDDETFPPAVGGAMDLAAGAKNIWVLMEHTARDGAPKILERCTYPLTAPAVVSRIYTNLAVIDVTAEGLVVREMAPGLDLAALQGKTGAPLRLANDWRPLTV
ncbi:MAG: 3-oxoacid CoA-transferase subunit B [Rhodospirillales bacterium]|nr:3-oxoacid CoA-transferase subunit B [Rhodospirillales bacterium]